MTNLLHAFPAQLDTVDGPVNASVILSWTPDRPMVMTFDMATAAGRQRWDISRDLVLDALNHPGEHGEGDVITEARDGDFLLFLHGTDDHDEWVGAQVRMPLGTVGWITEQSVQIVAPGSAVELLAVEAAIGLALDKILDGAA